MSIFAKLFRTSSAAQPLPFPPPPPPKIVDVRPLTERNREVMQNSISQLELVESRLEAEIADRQDRLHNVRVCIRAFAKADDLLASGDDGRIVVTADELKLEEG